MPRILLTHGPDIRAETYGPAAVAGLERLSSVTLNDRPGFMPPDQLVAAAGDCDIIVADRLTPGAPSVFSALPRLKAFVRCAMDIRNIDIAAASREGVLVTHAGPGFIDSVVEL